MSIYLDPYKSNQFYLTKSNNISLICLLVRTLFFANRTNNCGREISRILWALTRGFGEMRKNDRMMDIFSCGQTKSQYITLAGQSEFCTILVRYLLWILSRWNWQKQSEHRRTISIKCRWVLLSSIDGNMFRGTINKKTDYWLISACLEVSYRAQLFIMFFVQTFTPCRIGKNSEHPGTKNMCNSVNEWLNFLYRKL